MSRVATMSGNWILYLTSALLYAAVLLRALADYQASPARYPVFGILVVWLVLFVGETWLSQRWRRFFPPYLVFQCALALALLFLPSSADYFAGLFCILSMQTMQRLNAAQAWSVIALFTPVLAVPLVSGRGALAGIAFAGIYTAGNVLLASYTRASRRALAARAQNESLARELEETNRQIQAYSIQREKLAAARERQRLARELHDAATQTIFSMSLATQSAVLLLDRDQSRVSVQLERLSELAQQAASEMRALVSELQPDQVEPRGLVAALREHLARGRFSEALSVALEAEGEALLSRDEEQALLRITQEALNNVVKHAQAARVWIRLKLCEPFSIEIQDDGCGFDLEQAEQRGRVGLTSMRERAAEIGWDLQVITSRGAGTRIRADKMATAGRRQG